MKTRIIIIMFAVALAACTSKKDKFMNEYKTFATDFLEEYDDYTDTDWDAAEMRYKELREQYADYMTELTQTERRQIDEWNNKINAAFIEEKAEDAASSLQNVLKEAIGTLKEFLQ